MRLVLAALSRPITIVVALVAIALTSILAIQRMPEDIFPDVGDPAIYVAQPYGGMDPAQMEGFLTYYYEYHFLYITGIEHVESKSIQGAALMKLVFFPGTDMAQAMSETVGYVNRARAFMPPGTVPPFITRFGAGSVAVGQLVFSSANRTQGEMQDIALNRVRPLFATLPGVSAPPPFGGNQRTIVVTLDPDKLQQYRVSPEDAIAAVNKATLVMPSGNVSTGTINRIARTNATLGGTLTDLLGTPIHPGSGPSVYLRDIGTIENGTDLVTAYAHVNGKRTVYIPVTKRADASTVDVINRVRAAIPDFKKVVPEDVDVRLEFDQSPYVRNSIRSLVLEGLLGAALTGLMVLLFLRDWRSALIVVANIPFALLAAVVLLWLTGQTINIMTLGGLALAVGVLVDEATVEIENIHTQMRPGVSRAKAVVEACSRTAISRLLSMLCILAVFVPSFFMVGVGRQLFVPLSLAVGFAMIASYLLSSTLVPVFSTWLMREAHRGEEIEGWFGRIRAAYTGLLDRLAAVRVFVVGVYAVLAVGLVVVLLPRAGTEIFPQTDAGLMRLRLRAPTGTRVEETERLSLRALDTIARVVGPSNVTTTSDFIGVQPASYPVNLIHLFTSGSHEAILQLSLRSGVRGDEALRERLREALHQEMPDVRVSFEAGDIVSQVMSFGSATPVEVGVFGPSLDENAKFAAKIQQQLLTLSFLRDVAFAQPLDYPTLDIDVDRTRAGQFGLTMADVTRSVVPATSSSRFTEPNFWRDPVSGNAFQIQVEIPQNRMQDVDEVGALPIAPNGDTATHLVDVATVRRGRMPGLIERYNGQHVVSVTANLHDIALGDAAAKIQQAIAAAGEAPRGVSVRMRGQVPALEQTLSGLRIGLLLAVVAIFLLLAAHFQSLRLACIVILTIPAVLAGALIMLRLTATTLNVQSFMGAIMAIGIAVANSILLVTFAERFRHDGQSASEAARAGAVTRLRAILMTATAMIVGMLPMAIGISDAGSQAAPLGRAVIGGLLAATVTTLVVLPAMYSLFQRSASLMSPSLNPLDPESRFYDA
ncbi:MAG TPA: efflux RND transporter permease subunit [Vicinamibacterales bacterium]|nr:efflux RND transporter permease subunit [Vicinamibacterales bacterium]